MLNFSKFVWHTLGSRSRSRLHSGRDLFPTQVYYPHRSLNADLLAYLKVWLTVLHGHWNLWTRLLLRSATKRLGANFIVYVKLNKNFGFDAFMSVMQFQRRIYNILVHIVFTKLAQQLYWKRGPRRMSKHDTIHPSMRALVLRSIYFPAIHFTGKLCMPWLRGTLPRQFDQDSRLD